MHMSWGRLLVLCLLVATAMGQITLPLNTNLKSTSKVQGIVAFESDAGSTEALSDKWALFTLDVEIGGQTMVLQVDTGA